MPDDQFLRYAEAGASPEELSRALQAMARGEGFVSVSGGVVTVIVGSTVGGGSNVAYQMSTKDLNDLSYTDAAIATVVGGLTQGKGLAGTAGISMGGAYVGSQIKQEDPTAPVIGAGVGSTVGTGAVKSANKVLPKSFPDKIKEIMGAVWGGFVTEAVSEGTQGSVKGTER